MKDMKALDVQGTDETPRILFDKEKGVFEISGRSLPEDSAEFFNPVLDWVREYKTNPNPSTELVLKLDYLNTASSKFIQDILTEFEEAPGTRIVWYHLDDDESMEEIGKEYSELIDVPFEFRIYN
jgi:Domain of unknown function (DUF1987).